MNLKRAGAALRSLVIVLCNLALLQQDCLASLPLPAQAAASAPSSQAAKIPDDQLDSLVAPIALYPDPLLAQVLAASTYPLEIIQLQQWLAQHKDPERQGAGRCRDEAGLGSKYSRPGTTRRCRETPGRRHQVDHRPGKRLFGAAIRRDGRGATHAREGPGERQSEANEQIRLKRRSWKAKGDRHRTGQSSGRLRSDLRSGRCLWRANVSLSADLLSPGGVLRGGNGALFRSWLGHGRHLGWGLGLRMRWRK